MEKEAEQIQHELECTVPAGGVLSDPRDTD